MSTRRVSLVLPAEGSDPRRLLRRHLDEIRGDLAAAATALNLGAKLPLTRKEIDLVSAAATQLEDLRDFTLRRLEVAMVEAERQADDEDPALEHAYRYRRSGALAPGFYRKGDQYAHLDAVGGGYVRFSAPLDLEEPDSAGRGPRRLTDTVEATYFRNWQPVAAGELPPNWAMWFERENVRSASARSAAGKTVRVYEVIYDIGRPGANSDYTDIYRTRSERDAKVWAAGNTCYGGDCRVQQADVPLALARRWGLI